MSSDIADLWAKATRIELKRKPASMEIFVLIFIVGQEIIGEREATGREITRLKVKNFKHIYYKEGEELVESSYRPYYSEPEPEELERTTFSASTILTIPPRTGDKKSIPVTRPNTISSSKYKMEFPKTKEAREAYFNRKVEVEICRERPIVYYTLAYKS